MRNCPYCHGDDIIIEETTELARAAKNSKHRLELEYLGSFCNACKVRFLNPMQEMERDATFRKMQRRWKLDQTYEERMRKVVEGTRDALEENPHRSLKEVADILEITHSTLALRLVESGSSWADMKLEFLTDDQMLQDIVGMLVHNPKKNALLIYKDLDLDKEVVLGHLAGLGITMNDIRRYAEKVRIMQPFMWLRKKIGPQLTMYHNTDARILESHYAKYRPQPYTPNDHRRSGTPR